MGKSLLFYDGTTYELSAEVARDLLERGIIVGSGGFGSVGSAYSEESSRCSHQRRTAWHPTRISLATADVVRARPTGVGHALTTCTIPIEGRDEWIAAAERLA